MRPGLGDGREGFRSLPLALKLGLSWVVVAEPVRWIGLQAGVTVAAALLLIAIGLPSVFNAHLWRVMSGPQVAVAAASLGFVLWSVIRLITAGPTTEGFQNVAVYWIFAITLFLALPLASDGWGRPLTKSIVWLAAAGVALGVPISALVGPAEGGRYIGTGALVALAAVGLAAATADNTLKLRWLMRAIFFAVILISLSRVYIVFALICFTVPPVGGESLPGFVVKWILRSGAATALGYFLITRFEPLAQRFAVNDGKSIAGIQIGTSGRSYIWSVLLSDRTPQSDWVGRGPGHSQTIVQGATGTVSQPHNDYIRLFVDLGWVGLILWLMVLVLLLSVSFRQFARNFKSSGDRQISMLAILLIVLLTSGSLLDNFVVYVFFMAPVAVIVGLLMPVSSGNGAVSDVHRNARLVVQDRERS